jgi:hypothetical protein
MEDWKNERAEFEMRNAGEEIMKKAAEIKKHEDDPKWEKLKESLYLGNKTEDDIINSVIDTLKAKYHFPTEL